MADGEENARHQAIREYARALQELLGEDPETATPPGGRQAA
jgi:hypothetical protein